jgi:hypothetical protein
MPSSALRCWLWRDIPAGRQADQKFTLSSRASRFFYVFELVFTFERQIQRGFCVEVEVEFLGKDELQNKILRSHTAFRQRENGKFLFGRLHWDLTWLFMAVSMFLKIFTDIRYLIQLDFIFSCLHQA